MDQPYIGAIMLFAGNFAPRGWAFCDGQLLSITQYTALFSILGTYFGGNGVSNFALPDLRGRVPVHQGQGNGLSPYVIGQSSGVENVTLLTGNLPVHTHSVNASSGAASRGGTSPAGGVLAVPSGSVEIYSTSPPNATMNPLMIGVAGSNVPVSIIQPYLCVSFIIAMDGLFPSRN